ncbi:MAG: tol-pal system-associated acyl-CoA thioesterase [Chloroflexi bacterium]|nr:tol-pal system-associated acyl-CoA thioesterase [Chloroflexota bacterium]
MDSNFSFDCRVYFEDTDAGGVVYNANYLKFYERARTEYLRSLGFEQDDLLAQNIVFVVRSIGIDFIKAARFNEMLRVETQVGKLKKVSLDFEQAIYCQREEKTVLLNKALVKVACVTADAFSPCAIPGDIVDKLQQ